MPDQQTSSDYDPIKDANRDSQTLPTFDNSKFVEKKRIIQIDGKTVIINNSFSYQSLPEVEVFSHENFNLLPKERPQDGYYLGEKLQSLRTTFNIDLDKHPLDEKISSIIVHSGYWKFFNKNGEEIPVILGPGRYEQVQKNLIPNDKISRFESVDMDL